MKTQPQSFVEVLEARIAPAAVIHLTDVDGDLVTIATNKGTSADLTAAITTSMPAGAVANGVSIDLINLAANSIFDGANLTIKAKPGPLGGDGLANVVQIDASNLNLGKLTVDGDLQTLSVGKGTPDSMVNAIKVNSTSGVSAWDLNSNVGKINVVHDLRGTEIEVGGAKLGVLKIGGSLIGVDAIQTGYVNVANGTIGKVVIKGDLQGGRADDSGVITAKDILAVKIGGNLIGGKDAATMGAGRIETTGSIGKLSIKGSIVGGDGAGSGSVYSKVNIGNVSIGGSLIGGTNSAAGQVLAFGSIGAIKVGHNVEGGTGSSAGKISGLLGIASLTVGGDVIGSSGSNSGLISTSFGGKFGPVKIGGSIIGGSGGLAGAVYSYDTLGNISIGGDIVGGQSNGNGVIGSITSMGAVKIKGSIIGESSAPIAIRAEPEPGSQLAIKSITVGGRVENTFIQCQNPDAQIGPVKVGGDWIASSIRTGIDSGGDFQFGTNDDLPMAGGNPTLYSKIASIVIGGKVVGTADKTTDSFTFVSQEIGALKVNGVKVALQAGRGNDLDATDSHFILGPTRDVTVHEVA